MVPSEEDITPYEQVGETSRRVTVEVGYER